MKPEPTSIGPNFVNDNFKNNLYRRKFSRQKAAESPPILKWKHLPEEQQWKVILW